MSNARVTPTLCPLCLAANVIATAGGPTCTHQSTSGTAWFPDWWHLGPFDEVCTARRCAWLQERADAISPP